MEYRKDLPACTPPPPSGVRATEEVYPAGERETMCAGKQEAEEEQEAVDSRLLPPIGVPQWEDVITLP